MCSEMDSITTCQEIILSHESSNRQLKWKQTPVHDVKTFSCPKRFNIKHLELFQLAAPEGPDCYKSRKYIKNACRKDGRFYSVLRRDVTTAQLEKRCKYFTTDLEVFAF